MTDDGQRIAAMMMLAGGVNLQDAAEILGVEVDDIRRWLAQPHQDKGTDDE
jgi:uncharacterized protein YjcR